jgi:hypothetical protein
MHLLGKALVCHVLPSLLYDFIAASSGLFHIHPAAANLSSGFVKERKLFALLRQSISTPNILKI